MICICIPDSCPSSPSNKKLIIDENLELSKSQVSSLEGDFKRMIEGNLQTLASVASLEAAGEEGKRKRKKSSKQVSKWREGR